MTAKRYLTATDKAMAYRERHGPIKDMTTRQLRRFRRLLNSSIAEIRARESER